MAADPSFQATVRSLMRERVLDAAAELAGQGGWARMRMAHVAKRAGVSRQTLYNEVGSKAALGEALVMRETERFLRGVRERLDEHAGDPDAAFAAAVTYTLREAAANPLLRAILTAAPGGGDGLLPLLTTRSQPILAAASAMLADYVRDRWPELADDDDALAFALDTVVRLTVSHIVLPLDSPESTGDRIGSLALRMLH